MLGAAYVCYVLPLVVCSCLRTATFAARDDMQLALQACQAVFRGRHPLQCACLVKSCLVHSMWRVSGDAYWSLSQIWQALVAMGSQVSVGYLR